MVNKKIQMLVGPTQLPQRVRNAMLHEAMSHRSEEYKEIQHNVTEGIKKIFKTENDVLMLTTSGTGAMEATIQNVFKAGDEVIVPINGVFGELFYDVASGYDLDIIRVEFEYGTEVDVDEVMSHVTDNTKAVLLIHNESSTGVVNNIQKFGEALKDSDTLLVVDSVSGAGGINIEMDNWHVDIVFTASQKALMSPPGISFVALNDRAWERVDEVGNNTYLFNFKKDRDYVHRNLTVHTPATHTMLAVNEALKMIFEEGLENVFERHKKNAKLVRKGVKELGLQLYPKNEAYASPTITTIYAKSKAKYYVNELKKYNIEIGGGKNPLSEDTFRVGTMGYVSENDVIAVLAALKEIVSNEDK